MQEVDAALGESEQGLWELPAAHMGNLLRCRAVERFGPHLQVSDLSRCVAAVRGAAAPAIDAPNLPLTAAALLLFPPCAAPSGRAMAGCLDRQRGLQAAGGSKRGGSKARSIQARDGPLGLL